MGRFGLLGQVIHRKVMIKWLPRQLQRSTAMLAMNYHMPFHFDQFGQRHWPDQLCLGPNAVSLTPLSSWLSHSDCSYSHLAMSWAKFQRSLAGDCCPFHHLMDLSCVWEWTRWFSCSPSGVCQTHPFSFGELVGVDLPLVGPIWHSLVVKPVVGIHNQLWNCHLSFPPRIRWDHNHLGGFNYQPVFTPPDSNSAVHLVGKHSEC